MKWVRVFEYCESRAISKSLKKGKMCKLKVVVGDINIKYRKGEKEREFDHSPEFCQKSKRGRLWEIK